MITGTMIKSQLLVTARATITMLNIKADLDQSHDHNQDPVPVILVARDMIMVTITRMMTPGEGNDQDPPLTSQV